MSAQGQEQVTGKSVQEWQRKQYTQKILQHKTKLCSKLSAVVATANFQQKTECL